MELTHIRVDFGFGLQMDRDGQAIGRQDQQLALIHIRNEAARLFSAYTVVYVCGGWTNSQGKLVKEDGVTLFTIQPRPAAEEQDAFDAKINSLASTIKQALLQEAVAVSQTPCNFRLI